MFIIGKISYDWLQLKNGEACKDFIQYSWRIYLCIEATKAVQTGTQTLDNLFKGAYIVNKKEFLDNIIQEIMKLSASSEQQEMISKFIGDTINGGDISSHLIINIQIDKNSIEKTIIYILTNVRLILITIKMEKFININSNAWIISDITEIVRKLEHQNKATIEICFKDNMMRLQYPESSPKVIDFFQKVEKTWTSRV